MENSASSSISLLSDVILPNAINDLQGSLSDPSKFLATKSLLKYENCFLFYLKSFFHSQDIKIFVLTFWSYCHIEKTAL